MLFLLQYPPLCLRPYTVFSMAMWVCFISQMACRAISYGFHYPFSYHCVTGSGGLSFLQFCNLNSFKNKFILGLSIFLGLSVPQYFNEDRSVAGRGPVHTPARWVCYLFVNKFTSIYENNSRKILFASNEKNITHFGGESFLWMKLKNRIHKNQ